MKVIKCTNVDCARVFEESEMTGLQFTGFKCPDCHSEVRINSIIDVDIENAIEKNKTLPLLSRDELAIILELIGRERFSTAKDIAEEVDMNSYRIARICKKLDEERGVVIRNTRVSPYEYSISEEGKKYGASRE